MEKKKTYNFDEKSNYSNYSENKLKLNEKEKLDLAAATISLETPLINAITQQEINSIISQASKTKETQNAIKKWYHSWHNINLDVHSIKLVHGTTNAMHQTIEEFTNENDNILLMTPIYKPIAEVIKNSKRNIIAHELKVNLKKLRYEINYQELEQQIITNAIKLIIFCNPHNPSSRVWSKEELIALKNICNKYKVLIFSDEVHSDITYTKFTSLLTLNYNNLIVANSPNKSFNLASLKASYLIIKDNEVKKRIDHRYEKNLITTPNVFVIDVFKSAYLNPEVKEWLEQFKEYITSNFTYLKPELEKLDMQVFNLEANYLLWIKTSKSSKRLKEKLETKNILIQFGADFYHCSDQFIRINIATSKKNLETFITILKTVI